MESPPVSASTLCLLFCLSSVFGIGVDPSVQIDVLSELQLGDSVAGVRQVQGLHNGSKAFFFQELQQRLFARENVSFQDALREVSAEEAAGGAVKNMRPKRNVPETATIHKEDVREDSDEDPEEEADMAKSFMAKGLTMIRIYERVVEKPYMNLPVGTTFWLGQRNSAHGFFKGIMQDVQFLIMPQGFISQCPDLNRTCPTCNDFHGLVQKIMELQDILAKTSAKLSRAEQRMDKLDQCYCERTCTMKGISYREFESWTDGCKNCTCMNGTIQCETLICPLFDCPHNSAPAYVDGKCCKECQQICVFEGKTYFEGERKSVYLDSEVCFLFECKNYKMQRTMELNCPALNCPESQQISLSKSCCKVCKEMLKKRQFVAAEMVSELFEMTVYTVKSAPLTCPEEYD
ncbi:protein kinase C-binding protein NELL2 [Protobothrops mucrosquamatus]|uniref:protein kinase C-binding protein NELL2 n=1 Tax=Protobothrops mucrosquamatus TaxID=103944 RepID=UPI000775AA79|nr:protein kinase C-binding protein NELL2 [Protobothrops mucrosquamatus]